VYTVNVSCIKCGVFFDLLSDCYIVKKASAC
jgi:hypothetical protein